MERSERLGRNTNVLRAYHHSIRLPIASMGIFSRVFAALVILSSTFAAVASVAAVVAAAVAAAVAAVILLAVR